MSTSEKINKLKASMERMAIAPDANVVPMPAPSTAASTSTAGSLAPSRRGKRNVSAYIDASAAKQLRILAAEREASTQSLLEEALNDLFRKYGKSAIA